MYKPRYVTLDDYKNYWGEDLRIQLKEETIANSFIYRVEDRLMNWIDRNTFRIYNYENLTCFQLDNFKKAILNQTKYMLEQGDIAMDSGYDMEEGVKIRQLDLKSMEICRPAQDYLANAGLLNFTIKNRRRSLFRDGGFH